MSRFSLLLLLSTIPLSAQSSAPPKHRPAPPAADRGNPVNEIDRLQSRARETLHAELSRKLDPSCNSLTLSKVDFSNCFARDAAITQRNYQAFVHSLEASLAIEPDPNIDRQIYPAVKNFASGETAWRSYVDKTCEALGDTDAGGTGTGFHLTDCKQKLTRQHMKDLGWLFLSYDRYHFSDLH